MTISATRPSPRSLAGLRGVYLARAVFAVAWALAVVVAMPDLGPVLTALLVVYPVVDAGAVVVAARSDGRASSPRIAEKANIVVSCLVAIAVGVASTMSIAAAVGVWGAWAVLSGATQLITAVQRRRAGGQTPQILSGAISVAAGTSFVAQAVAGSDSITGVGGYALLGGLFFLVSAGRLTMILRASERARS
ncbi:DUF308 domain-containing protein [uncultured Williamsia sp.]|uniref:DUF308 domain-containing protein n=1 Tax=uncultured Williamsia sp. TaxID=259311 RepID=UPI002604E852|nr:DUF308 domain-containing protein [uncultured Williamsia sp.]